MSTSVEIILKELKVSSVDDLTEEFCKNIKKLNLYSRGLKDLNGCENIFRHLKNLEFLYLQHNFLANIDKDTFKYNINLKELYLSGNPLANIDKDTFKYNINLKRLYLSDNFLVNIDKDTFKYNINLQTLFLFNIPLANIDKDTFKYNIKLERLVLFNNPLANIDKDVFKYNINLKELYIYGNNLKSLKGIPHSIPVLYYGDNPLTEYPRNLEELKEYNRNLALSKIRNVFLKIYVQRIVDNYWYAPSKEILENGEVIKVSRYCIWCKSEELKNDE